MPYLNCAGIVRAGSGVHCNDAAAKFIATVKADCATISSHLERKDGMIACPARNKWVTAMARYIVALVLLAIIAGPAFAQQKPPENPLAVDAQQKKKEAL